MEKNTLIPLLLISLLAGGHTAFAEDQPASIKIACIGDSITFGHGIQDRTTNSYPAQLQRMLGPDYVVKNFGVNSATLLKKGNKPYWTLPQFTEAQAFQPDIVTIMLGTNDTKPRNWIHKDEFEANYIEMIKTFQALPGKPDVYLCTPIPVFPERWGINDQTVRQEVIPLVNKIAAETGLPVINLYKPLAGKADLVPDKVHPNAAGATLIAKAIAGVIGKAAAAPSPAQKNAAHEWEGEKSSFHSFDQYDFTFNGTDCKVVVPKNPGDGNPWVWRARFWGHQPQFDLAMLERGYYIVYCDVAHLFGNAEAIKRWNAFYDYLRFEHLLDDRAVLEGMSRGGLIVYNWAAANPDKVKAIYGDAPVMDCKSWPGGKGKGKGSPKDWEACLEAYGLTEQQALAYKGNPIDKLAPLAHADIPIIHVVGDADETVPVAENTAIAEAAYKKMGGRFNVIHKPGVGHHPHSLKDPSPLVDFILKQEKRTALPADQIVGKKNFILRSDFLNSRIQFEKNKRGHVAFLGGSITEMNGYRPMVCDMLKKRFPETAFTFTDAGIASTRSDTGAFRLQRDVLSKGPLDLLFVEFAVNDDQDGLQQSYNEALRGMEGIIAQAREHNPDVDIVMTFFVNQSMLQQLQNGEMPASIAAHSAVAQHNHVSVNNLAQELADLITAGKMDWKTYGGTHPKRYGNEMCTAMISNALLKQWSAPLPADAEPRPYPAVKLLDEKSYTRGRFLPLSAITTHEHWKIGIPDWTTENEGRVRERFQQTPMIYSSTPGATLTLDFTGTAIGAYMLAGPDAAIIRCTVDGKQTKEIDTLCRYSGFNYPVTILFFNELNDGKHRLELEILPNRPGRSKPGGTAFRAIAFTAN